MTAWPQESIRELVDVVETWTPARAGQREFTYIDIGAVDQDAKRIAAPRTLACAEAPSRARQLVYSGDVLVSTVRPNLNAVARIPVHLDGATASTGFCVLRPRRARLVSNFLFRWVQSPTFVADMVSKATGASYPAVSDRIVLDSLIPLPPINEQRRIAAILDQADALRAKRREVGALLGALSHAMFIEMFGDPVSNPRGWPVLRMENVAEIVSGATPRTDVPAYWNGEVRWVTPKELSDRADIYIHKTERRLTEAGLRSCGATVLPAGAVLFSSRAPIGHTAICGVPMATNQGFKSLVPTKERLNPHYLLHWLRCRRSYLEGLGRGATFKEVSKAVVARIPIVVPPIELQTQFAQGIAVIEEIRSVCRQAHEELDSLFRSLLHRAFDGEL